MYKTIEDEESILRESGEKTVFILKHSISCPGSARAKRHIDALMETNPDIDIHLLIVQEQRELSRRLAERLEVKHESPQLLIIKNGQAAHVLNHGAITTDAVKALLDG